MCEVLVSVPRTIFSLGFPAHPDQHSDGDIARMTVAVLAYVVLHVTASVCTMYRPGIAISWDQKIAEADLRNGILNVRDNAETIAFYSGEAAERKTPRRPY